jgi:serine phosphatase RsbU (regulator of sigma subunit)/predicted ester cyclase
MSAEENLALVRRFFEAQGEGDLDALDEILAEDFVDRSLLPWEDPDREGYKRSVAEDHAAFSELRYIIEDQVATDDKVVSRLTIRRVHDRGYFVGIAPTGEEYEATGIVIHRIAGGKIAEEWSEGSGILGLTQQRLEQELRERERVEQELQVARSIQQASLPKEVPTLEGWQISPLYQPAREVGGDFYDFHHLSEGRLGLVVGDATGKGVPAALVMSTTCGMLQAVSQAIDSPSPGEVLEQVNETLLARIPTNMFVTCFYAILDPKSAHLVYANAGHDLPYLHRNGDAEELRARGMPLGLMPNMGYEEKETILHSGEAALLYSDGLVEAHDPEGDMFGFPRLRALIAEHGEKRSLGELLLEELYSFTGERWEQEDDITLLTLRRSAPLSWPSENSLKANFAEYLFHALG